MKKILIYKKRTVCAVVFILALGFAGVWIEINAAKRPAINIFEIEGQHYCVPKQYAHPNAKASSTPPIYLNVLTPDLNPMEYGIGYYVDRGEWWTKVSILVNKIISDLPYSMKWAKNQKTYSATVFVAEEYGLKHFTQPPEANQDNFDFWIEEKEGSIKNIISCSDQLTDNYIPHCRMGFRTSNLYYSISFNKRQLPDWRAIKNNSIALIEDWRCNPDPLNHMPQKAEPS